VVLSLEAEAPPPVAVVPPPPKPEPIAPTPTLVQPMTAPPAGHPGRPAKFIALGALVGAVVAGSVAIYTWRTYDGLQSTTHSDLDALIPADQRCPTMGAPMGPVQTFACNPGATVPADLANDPNKSAQVKKYKDDFSSGQTYANATTALWVVTGALAATSLVSFIIGERQSAKAEKEAHKTQAKLLQQSLRVAPVFSTTGGQLQASFEF
jgi:hypothetical protein